MSAKPTPTLDNLVDDDLDDLDDVLDDFTSRPPAPPPTALPPPSATLPSTTATGRPRNNTRVDHPPTSIPGLPSSSSFAKANDPSKFESLSEADEDALSNEFAKELARGMESLMKEIAEGTGAGVGAGSGSTSGEKEKSTDPANMTEEERMQAFKAAWEAMLIEGMDGNVAGNDVFAGLDFAGAPAPGAAAAGATGGLKGGDKSKLAGGFQDRIKAAMDKMKESEEKLGSSTSSGAAGGAPTPESLEALLASLGDLGIGGEGGEADDKELAGFLEQMMGQLLTKDVLYEPLKELADGFPGYLASPPTPLSTDDRERYEKQSVCVKKIIAVFEKSDYSDDNEAYGKEIVDLMAEMQTFGAPPPEIMGPLPPGLEGGIPGLGEDGCIVS